MHRQRFLSSAAGAAALAAVPRFTTAAGPVTVKVGFLDSLSGVFSDLGAYHKEGAQLAVDDLNRKGRVRYELVVGNDGSAPAIAGTEARRLVGQEGVDVLLGGTSSANGNALAGLTAELGIFNLLIGPQDSAITGAHATKSTYRFGPNARMLVSAMARRALALGHRWYFIQADYALGRDAYAQLSEVLRRAGGTEVGKDIVPVGTTDFSSVLTKVRNSNADVLVLANSGLDAANTARQFVDYGLNARMKLAGISLEDIYYKALPLDKLVGTTFPVLWAPTASPAARRLAAHFTASLHKPPSGRTYLGYMSMLSLGDRLQAAGTTKPEQLARAFDDHAFDAFKENRSIWRGCDHQCAQDTYAGALVSSKQFARTQFMYDIVGTVPAAESDSCDTPWAQEAKRAIAASTLATRENYSPKNLRA